MPAPVLEAARAELLEALGRFSPKVEPDAAREGVLWLDPSGLGTLFGPLERWAAGVHEALGRLGLTGAVVVGFARLPTWAVARTHGGAFVIESPAEEASLASRAPLVHLEILPELRDALSALGVSTLGDFLALPRGEVGLRFGPEARSLHALFADALRPPMQAVHPEEPILVEAELEEPDGDLMRLLFCIKGGLHALMADLARRSLALNALEVRLELETAPPPMTAEHARAVDFAIARGAIHRASTSIHRTSTSIHPTSTSIHRGHPSSESEERTHDGEHRRNDESRRHEGEGCSHHDARQRAPAEREERRTRRAEERTTDEKRASRGSRPAHGALEPEEGPASARDDATPQATFVTERIEPARPTRDALSVVELVRLRFASVTLPARVTRIVLRAEPGRLDGTQLSLFAGRRHDPEAAARGIARLRAAFGDDAVTRAVLRDAWLPEEAFTWEPTDRVAMPSRDPPTKERAPASRLAEEREGVLVRRVLQAPIELPSTADGRPRTRPPIEAMIGPYRLQGGFWVGEHARDYFYAERADGALLWIFRDRRRGRWFLHAHLD